MPMNLTRIADAPAYDPQEHNDMRCLRLQGFEAGPASQMWLGLSHILPGGHTTLRASPQEKMYVCIAGAVTVLSDGPDGQQTVTLGPLDSVRIAPGEARALENRTTLPATVLLAMATGAG